MTAHESQERSARTLVHHDGSVERVTDWSQQRAQVPRPTSRTRQSRGPHAGRLRTKPLHSLDTLTPRACGGRVPSEPRSPPPARGRALPPRRTARLHCPCCPGPCLTVARGAARDTAAPLSGSLDRRGAGSCRCPHQLPRDAALSRGPRGARAVRSAEGEGRRSAGVELRFRLPAGPRPGSRPAASGWGAAGTAPGDTASPARRRPPRARVLRPRPGATRAPSRPSSAAGLPPTCPSSPASATRAGGKPGPHSALPTLHSGAAAELSGGPGSSGKAAPGGHAPTAGAERLAAGLPEATKGAARPHASSQQGGLLPLAKQEF